MEKSFIIVIIIFLFIACSKVDDWKKIGQEIAINTFLALEDDWVRMEFKFLYSDQLSTLSKNQKKLLVASGDSLIQLYPQMKKMMYDIFNRFNSIKFEIDPFLENFACYDAATHTISFRSEECINRNCLLEELLHALQTCWQGLYPPLCRKDKEFEVKVFRDMLEYRRLKFPNYFIFWGLSEREAEDPEYKNAYPLWILAAACNLESLLGDFSVFSSKWKGEGGQSNASFIPWIIEMYYY